MKNIFYDIFSPKTSEDIIIENTKRIKDNVRNKNGEISQILFRMEKLGETRFFIYTIFFKKNSTELSDNKIKNFMIGNKENIFLELIYAK